MLVVFFFFIFIFFFIPPLVGLCFEIPRCSTHSRAAFTAATLKTAVRREASDLSLSPRWVLAAVSADVSLAEAQVSRRSRHAAAAANEINRMP